MCGAGFRETHKAACAISDCKKKTLNLRGEREKKKKGRNNF
jgi:hypothetical protein